MQSNGVLTRAVCSCTWVCWEAGARQPRVERRVGGRVWGIVCGWMELAVVMEEDSCAPWVCLYLAVVHLMTIATMAACVGVGDHEIMTHSA